VITGNDGSFTFEGLDPEGTFTVTVDPTTLPDDVINTVDPDGVLDGTTEIDLSESGGMSIDENDFGYEEEVVETDAQWPLLQLQARQPKPPKSQSNLRPRKNFPTK